MVKTVAELVANTIKPILKEWKVLSEVSRKEAKYIFYYPKKDGSIFSDFDLRYIIKTGIITVKRKYKRQSMIACDIVLRGKITTNDNNPFVHLIGFVLDTRDQDYHVFTTDLDSKTSLKRKIIRNVEICQIYLYKLNMVYEKIIKTGKLYLKVFPIALRLRGDYHGSFQYLHFELVPSLQFVKLLKLYLDDVEDFVVSISFNEYASVKEINYVNLSINVRGLCTERYSGVTLLFSELANLTSRRRKRK